MTGKRFLSADERRARAAVLPADWHIAGVAAGNAMAGTATPADTVAALRRVLDGETTGAEERAAIHTQRR